MHCMTKKRNYTRYAEKYKLSVLEYAKEFGVVKASKDYGLPTKTILRWNDIFHIYEKQVMRTFSDETKKEVLEYANNYGLTSAMREYDIDTAIILTWNKIFKIYQGTGRRKNATHQKKFEIAPVEKQLEILKFAKEHGPSKAIRKYNVPMSSLRNWNKELKVYPVRKPRTFTPQQKQQIVHYAMTESVPQAACMFNVYSSQIYTWAKSMGKVL